MSKHPAEEGLAMNKNSVNVISEQPKREKIVIDPEFAGVKAWKQEPKGTLHRSENILNFLFFFFPFSMCLGWNCFDLFPGSGF